MVRSRRVGTLRPPRVPPATGFVIHPLPTEPRTHYIGQWRVLPFS